MAKSVFDNEQLLREAALASNSLADIIRYMGLKYSTKGSGNFRTLRRHLEKFSINTSHFDPNAARAKSLRQNVEKIKIPLTDILSGTVTYNGGSNFLKGRLYREGVKTPKCEECGLGDNWNEKPIVHQLDHVDGDSGNNKLENLRILCPNCHSQTVTFSRKK
jgi:5-methylcytosine-specific restriction endonuclease McrA